MRAARLLRMLLLLQNRGQQTSAQLAAELEVTPRTILRDVDAMTEAGLPIIVHQGNRGGIELGFNYRTRLTGLTQDEAEALGMILGTQNPLLDASGLYSAGQLARAKLIESFPDTVRHTVQQSMKRFTATAAPTSDDQRIGAFVTAIRHRSVVRINVNTTQETTIHPIALHANAATWQVHDGLIDTWIAVTDCGNINISARRF